MLKVELGHRYCYSDTASSAGRCGQHLQIKARVVGTVIQQWQDMSTKGSSVMLIVTLADVDSTCR